MAGSWGRGWDLVVHSLNVFKAYPIFIFPILMVWMIYAPSILYLKYVYRWDDHDSYDDFGVAILVIFGFSFIMLLACDMVLEMIKQIETGHPSFGKAIGKAFSFDLISILPLAFVWAIIWFALTVIEALVSKVKRGDYGDDEFNAQNAAATLAGFQNVSLSGAFFNALQKGIRMVMFLIVPAIAWDNLDVIDSTKKGLVVLRAHLGEFGAGYALTYAAAGIVFLPPAIILELGTKHHGAGPLIHFPDSVWVGVIIYIGLAWSFCVYLEQMFMAQLYLWHLKWENEIKEAKQHNLPLPVFSSVARPELLAKTPGLFS